MSGAGGESRGVVENCGIKGALGSMVVLCWCGRRCFVIAGGNCGGRMSGVGREREAAL